MLAKIFLNFEIILKYSCFEQFTGNSSSTIHHGTIHRRQNSSPAQFTAVQFNSGENSLPLQFTAARFTVAQFTAVRFNAVTIHCDKIHGGTIHSSTIR
jgi:hypothetical protein